MRNQDYSIYGAVPLETIKQTLLDLEAASRLDHVRMVLLTNCTFDGVVYNPQRVMEEALAIKPDICFLWDEAWYAFAIAVPWVRQRTAMVAAERLEEKLEPRVCGRVCPLERGGGRRAEVRVGPASLAAGSGAGAGAGVLRRIRRTKSLSALRQASMIHVRDQDFNKQSREAFAEAFLVLALVKAFLKAGILGQDGALRDNNTGTPQGGNFFPRACQRGPIGAVRVRRPDTGRH
jgi:arginine decarboxylase